MMGDVDVFRELIVDNAIIDPVVIEGGNNRRLRLTEPQNWKSNIDISNVPSNTLAIKADAFHAPNHFFKGDRGELRRADYFIVSEKPKCIVCIEMKISRDYKYQIVEQLHGARCIVSYCREIGISFWEKADFLEGYKQWYVYITRIPFNKRSTFQSNKSFYSHSHSKNDSPEKAWRFSGTSVIPFNKLMP